VASLRLDDIDWPAGTATIRGKGGRIDRMPPPLDAGQALVDYLQHGRQDTPARTVRPRDGGVHPACLQLVAVAFDPAKFGLISSRIRVMRH
jgi:hypothetical protein